VTEEIDDDDDDVIVEDGVGDDWIEEERQRGDGEVCVAWCNNLSIICSVIFSGT